MSVDPRVSAFSASSQSPIKSSLITLDVTVGKVICPRREDGWAAIAILAGGYGSAAGLFNIDVERGAQLRLTGYPHSYRDKPQLRVIHAEGLAPAFHNADVLAFARQGTSRNITAKLVRTLGPDFVAKIVASPALLDAPELRLRQKTRAKILKACAVVGTVGLVKRSLLEAGVENDAIKRILAIFNPREHSVCNLVPAQVISFPSADLLARTPFIQTVRPYTRDSAERIAGVVAQVMNDRRRCGHCGCSVEDIVAEAVKQYDLPSEKIRATITRLAANDTYGVLDGRLWHRDLLDRERHIASIAADKVACSPLSSRQAASIEKKIAAASAREGLILNTEQVEALINAESLPISVITGPPGSGKSTITCIIGELAGDQVGGCSFAGRAASRLEEVSGIPSQTIHRLLGLIPGRKLHASSENLIGLKTLVVDECSMIPSPLFASLLQSARGAGVKHIVLIGDADQLPPIEPGEPFFDLIASGKIATVRLKEVYRHSEGGGIAAICADINAGVSPLEKDYGHEVALREICEPERIVAEVVTAHQALLARGVDLDDIGIITPFNDRICGVHPLNATIRSTLGRNEATTGDLVIATRNDYEASEAGVFNGQRGIIQEFTPGGDMIVDIEGRPVIYLKPNQSQRGPADGLHWAYVSSVHRAQGGEFQHVIVALPPGCAALFDQPLIYTAASRARQSLMVVGDLTQIPHILARGARRRVTALPHLLNSPALAGKMSIGETVNWASVGVAAEQTAS